MYLIHLKILSVKNYFRLRNKIYITIYMKLKLLEIVLIIVLIVILLNINKQNNVMLRPNKPVMNNITKDNIITVAQEDILIENRGDPVKTTGNFPIPQSTTISKSLSTEYPESIAVS